MTTPDLPRRQRRAARIILMSPAGEVFLINFVVTRSDGAFAFWATPGGEVENGEADLTAAQRELREELGLTLPLEGPIHSATVEFEYNGAIAVSTDVYFAARCERDAPQLQAFTEEERVAIRAARWWTASEIEATVENVFPENLSALVRAWWDR